MASMETIKCKHCGKPKEVRTADLKRGWGLFCNKTCKALDQAYPTSSIMHPNYQPTKQHKKPKQDDLTWMNTRRGNSLLATLNRKIDQMEGPQMEPGCEAFAGPFHC